jgi:2-enoate reductase
MKNYNCIINMLSLKGVSEMEKKYKGLFEPFKINKLEIKNRFVMAPMLTPAASTTEGTYTNDSMEYYVRRAKGGVGLIITGANFVDNDIEKHVHGIAPSPVINPHEYPKIAGEMTYRIHSFGAKIFLQLTAGFGRSAIPFILLEDDFVAPSPTTNRWDPRIKCRELTTEEVETIVKEFAKSAEIAKKAGFDGIEVHAVHEGYLLDCFTMSLFNQRTDKYGGDLRGRLTFAIEIVQAIKAACGKDFPVILRFSIKSYVKAIRQGALPEEDFKELGRDVNEALEAAKILEEAGYDAFDADAGTYDSWYWAHPPMYFKKGMYLPLSEQLKKVAKVPVIVAGRMDDPDMAIEALETGKLDAIGLGRPLLTDPDYVIKLKTGRVNDIKHCLSCHDGCFERFIEGLRGSCAVNPECGRELITGINPTANKKQVVVIGGGVAGMEAARVSAIRGHKVTLFEGSNALGGHVIAGGVPDFKEDDRALAKWYANQLKKLNIDVKMNTRATKDMVVGMHPDTVFVATGSEHIMPKLPGIDNSKVSNACEVLLGKKKVNNNCVIVGGGLVGCELALHLAKQGKKVTIVEALNDILKAGSPLAPMNEFMLRDLLKFHNIPIKTSSTLTEIDNEGAVIKTGDSVETIPADNVILAMGFKRINALYEELKYDIDEIYNVGDGREVRNIRGAIWDAYEVARSI